MHCTYVYINQTSAYTLCVDLFELYVNFAALQRVHMLLHMYSLYRRNDDERPYRNGVPCSQCPENTTSCDDNLCSK